MAVKITDLPELDNPQSGDYLVIVDSENDATKKIEANKVLNVNSSDVLDRFVTSLDISDLSTGQVSFILDTPKTVSSEITLSDNSLTYDPVRYSVTGLPSNVSFKFLSFPVTNAVRIPLYADSVNLGSAHADDQDIFGPEQTSGFQNGFGEALDFTGESVEGAIGGDFDRGFISNGQTGDLIEARINSSRSTIVSSQSMGLEIYNISHGGDCIVELKESVTNEGKTFSLTQTGILTFNTGVVTYQFTADHVGS